MGNNMNNSNDLNKILPNSTGLKDYILLVRTNLAVFISIALTIIALAVIYALAARDIYVSTVNLKLNPQKQNVLDAQAPADMGGAANDRFISNEIEIINNYDSRERCASALIDSFDNAKDKSLFSELKAEPGSGTNGHLDKRDIIELLKNVVKAEQVSGLDIIEISAESPSPYEAALIANTFAFQYREINLENNRGQLTTVRKFLEAQRNEKLIALNNAEVNLKNYQQEGGIIALDAQSNVLINQLANLDALRDAAKVDLLTSKEMLAQYKKELGAEDPKLVDYLESQTSQKYIDIIQKQIAELQMNKELALSNNNSGVDVSEKIKDYDKKIANLKVNLSTVIGNIKAGAYASSPDQIRELAQKLIEEKVKNNSLAIRYDELQGLIGNYEQKFTRLPKKSMELAQYQRQKESLQQIYDQIETRYQEAMLNELSQPGNVIIVGKGRIPDEPSKPKPILIILVGIFAGLAFAFGYILVKDYFNDTIKSPDDIEDNNIKMLAWVPHLPQNENDYFSHLYAENPTKDDLMMTESFKSMRARIQFSKKEAENYYKTILVTSPAAQEGKTIVSTNLAASFARADNKVLLLDCDLIKPKVHTVMKGKRSPGITDYLLNQVTFEDVLTKTKINNLYYIAAGSTINNTDATLDSREMKDFLQKVRSLFDIIVIDSAPIVPVIDSQILARSVDGTLLVVSSDKTEANLMRDAYELITKDNMPFLGAVLNNFKHKNGYKYYYKYYYNYSANGNRHNKRTIKA